MIRLQNVFDPLVARAVIFYENGEGLDLADGDPIGAIEVCS